MRLSRFLFSFAREAAERLDVFIIVVFDGFGVVRVDARKMKIEGRGERWWRARRVEASK